MTAPPPAFRRPLLLAAVAVVAVACSGPPELADEAVTAGTTVTLSGARVQLTSASAWKNTERAKCRRLCANARLEVFGGLGGAGVEVRSLHVRRQEGLWSTDDLDVMVTPAERDDDHTSVYVTTTRTGPVTELGQDVWVAVEVCIDDECGWLARDDVRSYEAE